MRDFIVKLLANLVSNPEEISVFEKQDGSLTTYDLNVSPQEIGRVIGKNGNIIRAIRNLVRLKATQENKQVVVRLLEPTPEQS